MREQLAEQTIIIGNGQEAPNILMERYSGDYLTLGSLKGKVVHLCFWGTTCGPCLNELKANNLPAIIEKFSNNTSYIFIPIANSSKDELDKFFAPQHWKEYLWLKDITCFDEDKSIFNLFARTGIPRSIIIDQNGIIKETSIGFIEEELEKIDSTLKEFLKLIP